MPMKQRELTSVVQSYELIDDFKSYKLSRKIHTIVFCLIFINSKLLLLFSTLLTRLSTFASLLFVSSCLINQNFCGSYYWVCSPSGLNIACKQIEESSV